MKIQQVVQKIFANYLVEVYGSHATGLCLHWSDIDLVVGADEDKDIPGMMQETKIKDALGRISEGLKDQKKYGWVVLVNYIENATVPVIKIHCSLSALMDS